MDRRLKLHELLVGVLGTRHVYFQPPQTIKMVYPAIIYTLSGSEYYPADDLKYHKRRKYQVTIIDRNPDSPIPERLEELPHSRMSSYMAVENLHHFVYELYF